jgi:hypothetical protein
VIGDEITVIFDRINGSVKFMINQEDLGIAFTGDYFKNGNNYYPCVSMQSPDDHVESII